MGLDCDWQLLFLVLAVLWGLISSFDKPNHVTYISHQQEQECLQFYSGKLHANILQVSRVFVLWVCVISVVQFIL